MFFNLVRPATCLGQLKAAHDIQHWHGIHVRFSTSSVHSDFCQYWKQKRLGKKVSTLYCPLQSVSQCLLTLFVKWKHNIFKQETYFLFFLTAVGCVWFRCCLQHESVPTFFFVVFTVGLQALSVYWQWTNQLHIKNHPPLPAMYGWVAVSPRSWAISVG